MRLTSDLYMYCGTHMPLPPIVKQSASVSKPQLGLLSLTKLYFKIFKDPDFLLKPSGLIQTWAHVTVRVLVEDGSSVSCIKKLHL